MKILQIYNVNSVPMLAKIKGAFYLHNLHKKLFAKCAMRVNLGYLMKKIFLVFACHITMIRKIKKHARVRIEK